MSGEQSRDAPPLLRVVKGAPSDEEVAALVAVIAARRASAEAAGRSSKHRRRSAWGDPGLATRPVLRVGPGGWRRSALPG